MTNHTTFETSKLLAENGFPQPTPEFGQVWICEDCTFILAKVDRRGYAHGISTMGNEACVISPIDFKTLFFAPTAADIPLPGCVTRELDGRIDIYENAQNFSAGFPIVTDISHVEARATAWLFKNKKKDTI